VRRYCRYEISYRDLEQRMAERDDPVDHTTIYRWVLPRVQRIAPLSGGRGERSMRVMHVEPSARDREQFSARTRCWCQCIDGGRRTDRQADSTGRSLRGLPPS
jgi:hypothetical protein